MELSIKELREILRDTYQIEMVPAAELERLLLNQKQGEETPTPKAPAPNKLFPVEFTPRDIEIFEYVTANKLTMVPRDGLINTILSAHYVVKNDIDGDFVECGVWRGGNALAAKLVFDELQSNKKAWLYDTFLGMTEPEDLDFQLQSGKSAHSEFLKRQKEDHNAWCYASVEDVQQNLTAAGVALEGVRIVKGDIIETLKHAENIPDSISALRLDTDWYASTKVEMQVLYPRLTLNGVLIVDDYGYWNGSRKAIDEFFANSDYERPFLQVVYVTGTRCGIKTS
ncbi:MAG: TylF/MycF/NovP-related O-methyltransferase [Rhodospirillaceae bacterium]